MKKSASSATKLFLLGAFALVCATQNVSAQHSPSLGVPVPSAKGQSVLGQSRQTLLARYGKPTKIYSLAGSPPRKSLIPTGVPLLAPEKASAGEKSILPSLAGRQKSMIWFYKGRSNEAAYLLDALGYVQYAGSAETATVGATKEQRFEVSPLTKATLGDDVRRVLFSNQYPDEVRSISKSTHELVYWPKKASLNSGLVFTTVLTVRDHRVVRLYSYEDHARVPKLQSPFRAKPYLLSKTMR